MLKCQLRSPDRTFFDGEAAAVVARSAKGEFAVLPHHAPLLAELVPGQVRIRTDAGEERFACLGGILSVAEDRVVVLGSEVIPADEIDLDAARRLADDPSQPEAERKAARLRLELLEKLAGSHV